MSRRSRRQTDEAGPDLIPFMNLTTMLIPLLLLGASFVQLGVIDSTLPAIGPDKGCDTSCGDPPLNLAVLITKEGFEVVGADDVLAPEGETEGRRSIDGYDYTELTRTLALVKDEYPDDQMLILTPDSRVPYEVIIGAMDAARQDAASRELFPQVIIAGGHG